MTHTAELFIEITSQEYYFLMEHGEKKLERDKESGKIQHHLRMLENCGITDIRPRKAKAKTGFIFYYCVILINLQRVVNGGERTITTYDNEQNFAILSNNFKKYMSKLLPLRTNVNDWILTRIDYNIDIKLTQENVERYIILLQRGNKNYSWKVHELLEDKERRKKSKHAQRKITHPKGSVIFDNKQYSINIYNKLLEREKTQKERGIFDEKELIDSNGILRVEIQVKKNKLHTLKRKIAQYAEFEGRPLGIFAKYDIAIPLILQALEQITGNNDYFTYKKAVEIIEKEIKRETTKEAVISFLQLVSHTKSLWRAKEIYKNNISIDTVLANLKKLNINPVTIPVSFKLETMKNLFSVALSKLKKENPMS